jgi:fumarate hydratase, class I
MMSRILAQFSCKGVRTGQRSFATSFAYSPLFQSNAYNNDQTEFRQLFGPEAVHSLRVADGSSILQVRGEYLQQLAKTAFSDIAHLLRPAHLQQLRNILDDAEASPNDHFVAMELLRNANIAAARILPGCQDTGTAIIMGKRGHRVMTMDGQDEAWLCQGAADAYKELNLRYSQVAPIDMFTEKNTGNNMPAQIDLYADYGDAYKFLIVGTISRDQH